MSRATGLSVPAAPIRRAGTLLACLEEGLSRERGYPVQVSAVRRVWYDRCSHAAARLVVRLDTGEALPVTAKRFLPLSKPEGRREVLIYRTLLHGRRFGAPALYGSLYDETRGWYVLFLEDVGDESLRTGDVDSWLAAMRWLAELHSTYAGRLDVLRGRPLEVQDAGYFLRLANEARQNLVQAGRVPELVRFDRLMDALPGVAGYLCDRADTLVHGDLFHDNLMLQPGDRIRAIDWESAGIGVGALDLATLIDGWGEPARARLIAAYLEEIERRTRNRVDRDDFARTLLHCDIVVAIRYLGWDAGYCLDRATSEGLLTAIETALSRLRWSRQHD